MEDPFLPVPVIAEPCKPLTPSLLFQKLSELKMERELLTRHGEEAGLPSVTKESLAALNAPIHTTTEIKGQYALATLDSHYSGSEDGDRTLVSDDDLAIAMSMSQDKQLKYSDDLGKEAKDEEEEDKKGKDDDPFFGLLSRDLPPAPSPDASIAEHVRWQVVRVVHRAMDTLTLDLPQSFEGSRIGDAALHIIRIPTNIVSDSVLIRALRSRMETMVQGQLVRHVQDRYAYARFLVVSTVERDIQDICDQSDLLRDDVQVIGAHLDSLQTRLEAMVTQKVDLVSETMTRYVNEVIPSEFDRLLHRVMLADSALMRPIYDRVHHHLLPFVAMIVSTLTTMIQRHADWVDKTIVQKISDDFKGIRQQFAL